MPWHCRRNVVPNMTAVLEPLHIVGPDRNSLDDPGSGRPRPGRGVSSGRVYDESASPGPVVRTRSNSADNLHSVLHGVLDLDAGSASQRLPAEVRAWNRYTC